MPPLPAHNRKSISQAGAKGNVFFAHGLKIRSFQGVPESCRRQSCRGIPACMRRIGHRIVAPWVKTGLLHCRSDSCLRCGMRRMAAAPPDFPAWRSGRRAGADSPSAPGKQAKSTKGGSPAGGDRSPGRDASLPQKAGSDRKTLAQDTGREPSCRVPPDAGEPGTTLPCPSPETERGTPFGVPPSFRSVRDADYQLDLRTPGSSPRRAMLRKQIRQMPNWRMKARGRPQMGQRL